MHSIRGLLVGALAVTVTTGAFAFGTGKQDGWHGRVTPTSAAHAGLEYAMAHPPLKVASHYRLDLSNDLVDFGACVACVLDSDPKKCGARFLRWEVHAPDEAAELGLDAIVVSSRAYQEEMLRAVAHLVQDGVELVACYP